MRQNRGCALWELPAVGLNVEGQYRSIARKCPLTPRARSIARTNGHNHPLHAARLRFPIASLESHRIARIASHRSNRIASLESLAGHRSNRSHGIARSLDDSAGSLSPILTSLRIRGGGARAAGGIASLHRAARSLCLRLRRGFLSAAAQAAQHGAARSPVIKGAGARARQPLLGYRTNGRRRRGSGACYGGSTDGRALRIRFPPP